MNFSLVGRYVSLSILIGLWQVGPCLSDPINDGVAQVLYVSDLDWNDITSDSQTNWIAGETIPDKMAEPMITIRFGTRADDASRQIPVNLDRAQTGFLAVDTSLGESVQGLRLSTISYSIPVRVRSVSGPNAFYLLEEAPFESPTAVICQYHPNASGFAELSPIYIIPTDWVQFARPASNIIRSEIKKDAGSGEITRWGGEPNPNPFIDIFEWKRAISRNDLDGPTATKNILAANDVEQAVLVYTICTYDASGKSKVHAGDVIADGIKSATTLHQLRGIALGLLTASAKWPASKEYSSSLAARAQTLSTGSSDDREYITKVTQLAIGPANN